VRGDYANKQQGLRLKLQLPPGTKDRNGQPLNVSNIWDSDFGGHHIKYGSQIADHVTMSVSAVAIAGEPAPPVPCFGLQKKKAKGHAAAMAMEADVGEDSVTDKERMSGDEDFSGKVNKIFLAGTNRRYDRNFVDEF
jgi:hypothetical protein